MTETHTGTRPEAQTASERPRDDEMEGIVERVMLLGLGVVGVTKDAVKTLTDDLIERGKMSEKDANETAERVAKHADRLAEKMRASIREQTRDTVSSMGLATRDDVRAVEERISELSSLIATRGVVSSHEPYTP
jgi:polyhydroxyalkanoate synthesis regulator phasin